MRQIAPLAFPLLLLAACGEVTQPSADLPGVPRAARSGAGAASGGATHTTDEFIARATCGGEIGTIWFGGERPLVEHRSANSHMTTFRTQAFMGWRTPVTATRTNPTTPYYGLVAPVYEVLGGAEMFNRKLGDDGTMQIRIHEGTLVFSALDGSHKIVARHVIMNPPGGQNTVNEWRCHRVAGA
jgi:hypothetical protein